MVAVATTETGPPLQAIIYKLEEFDYRVLVLRSF